MLIRAAPARSAPARSTPRHQGQYRRRSSGSPTIWRTPCRFKQCLSNANLRVARIRCGQRTAHPLRAASRRAASQCLPSRPGRVPRVHHTHGAPLAKPTTRSRSACGGVATRSRSLNMAHQIPHRRQRIAHYRLPSRFREATVPIPRKLRKPLCRRTTSIHVPKTRPLALVKPSATGLPAAS
jgi:hypothetical protein